MNTGGQRSGAYSVLCLHNNSSPRKSIQGKSEKKKDLPEIVAAHGVPYVATATVAFLGDLKQKVKKAMTLHGPRYIQIDTPCPSVWNFPSHLTLEIGRLGVNSGLVPLFEMVNGKITKVKKLRTKVAVTEY